MPNNKKKIYKKLNFGALPVTTGSCEESTEIVLTLFHT